MVAIRGGHLGPRFCPLEPEKLTFVNVVTSSAGRHIATGELQAKTATRFYFGETGVIFRLKDGGRYVCRLFSR
jgi:hypothetical protein